MRKITAIIRSFVKGVSQILMIPLRLAIRKEVRNYLYARGITAGFGISHKAKIYSPASISDSIIGDYSYVSMQSHIVMTRIGKFCSIGPHFFCGWGIHPTDGISTSPMFYSPMKQNGFTFSLTSKIEEKKTIIIGNDVFIGANVTVLDGVCIGDGAIIGAGAVVSKDIPPYSIAVGCPIKVLRSRFPEDIVEKLLRIKWWDFSEEKLKDVERYFFDIDEFVKKYITEV
jgi:virginiamycin A acetyltransferase